MQTVNHLPGIFFEAQPPQPEAVLPRMDIAAFIGFAASGPLDIPVPVEDLGRFRELFGVDLVLAWNEERGEPESSCLGMAVEAFFRNGGQRCWVVRVAEEDTPVRRFRLPGLVPAGIERVDTAAPAEDSVQANARSAGSWANAVSVDTLLVRERLPFDRFSAEPRRYRLELRAPPAKLRHGELLEIVLGPEQPVLFLFVDRVEPLQQGTRLGGEHAYWYQPLLTSPVTDQPNDWLYLSEAEGLNHYRNRLDVASPTPTVHLLRFEIRTRHGSKERRVSDLAFRSDHPRCWVHLPSDAALFRHYQGRQPPAFDAEQEALRAQVNSPRFPLAGPDQPQRDYLPIGMSSLSAPPQAQQPVVPADEHADHDGLERFHAGLFFDSRLARLGTRDLLAEAEHKYYLQQESLQGFHSLLPVEEITLIAIPDAVHPAWNKNLPPVAESLPAPRLDPLPAQPDAWGRYRLSWSPVATASAYRLEYDNTPEFIRPTHWLVHGDDIEINEALVMLPDNCPQPRYFRVRARRHRHFSPWSQTRARVLPLQDFDECRALPIAELQLNAVPLGSPAQTTIQLIWTPAVNAGDYELQAAADADFFAARIEYKGPQTDKTVAMPLDAAVYYRVRNRRGDALGPWSNTVLLQPGKRSAHTLVARADYDPSELLAIQRALIRFCAARGDVLACLSLPRHYREQQALDHVAALLPAEEASSTDGTVSALNRDETGALSYAGLYHPWVALRLASQASGDDHLLKYSPPDGTILGQMAQQALTQGAWFAPANQVLNGVVALEPAFALDAWRSLTMAQVNLLRRNSRGFLAFNAETLARSDELRLINVRRLLILLRRLALREGKTYAFEPNDNDFRGLVRHRFERLLSELYVRGAFAGASPQAAFRVVTDDSVNTRQSLDLGRFIIELRVAPSVPLSFLTIRLLQTNSEQVRIEET